MVEFRLIRAYRPDPLRENKPSAPQGHIFPGKTMIYDPFKKTEIMIYNIAGIRPLPKTHASEEQRYEPEVANVVFPRTGSIFCTKEMNNLYFFLKLMNENQSNPWAKSRTLDGRVIGKVFFEVNPIKDTQKENNKVEWRRLALNIIAEASDKELLSICFNLNESGFEQVKVDMNLKGEALIQVLNGIAENYPVLLIKASENVSAKCAIYVNDMISANQIAFDDMKSTWFWVRKPGEKSGRKICTVEKGANVNRALIEYLVSESGSEDRVEIFRLAGEKSVVVA